MQGLNTLLLIAANLLMPVSLIVFASGFFPHKPFLTGLAEYQPLASRVPPTAPFNKVVFMVIDALRSDFLYSNASGFHFTQSLIRDGFAIPFTSHAQAPTVTMPRVKALTTGSIPSFLDMILNIAESDTTSTLAHQDTWIAQMRYKKPGKLVMYGDDTWLKLFPNTFDRADGTTSFFVSDFTEVDNNVTRHLPEELDRGDWNTIVLHYLGMDHIGHKSGSSSVNMIPKQVEMDTIVKQIYRAFDTRHDLSDALLVLCGDHGMTNAGNHGGSAPGETSPGMIFVSPKLGQLGKKTHCPVEATEDFQYYNVIEQSDVAPTLGGLLGFPVPLNNLGVFISDMLPLWSEEDDQVQLLYRNALQLVEIVKATFPQAFYELETSALDCRDQSSVSKELACSWKQAQDSLRADVWSIETSQEPLLKFCHKAQSALSSIASNYNATRLYAGIAVAFFATTLAFYGFTPKPSLTPLSPSNFKLLLSVLYVVMMFASSYVEEEHHFWYWMSAAWATLCCTDSTSPILYGATALSLRLLRRWNQSGQKYAGSDDIVLFLRSNPSFLAPLVLVTYGLLGYDLWSTLPGRRATVAIRALVLISAAALFKVVFTVNDAPELFGSYYSRVASSTAYIAHLVNLSRLVFLLCGIYLTTTLLWTYRQSSQQQLAHTFIAILTIFLSHQLRVTNIPTLLLFRAIWKSIRSSARLNESSLSLWTLLMAHVSFFALGGTNGISTIDLSNAYNGISSYNPIPVGLLLFISNWAGPIYWSVIGTVETLDLTNARRSPPARKTSDIKDPANTNKKDDAPDQWAALQRHLTRLTFFTTIAVLGVEAACCALREHLFVWTVFSPKFLYVGAWVVGWHLGVNVLLGCLITAVFG